MFTQYRLDKAKEALAKKDGQVEAIQDLLEQITELPGIFVKLYVTTKGEAESLRQKVQNLGEKLKAEQGTDSVI